MTNAENTLKNLKNYLAAVIRANPHRESDDRQAGRIDVAGGALLAIQVLEDGVITDLGFREAPEPEPETYTVQVDGKYWYIANLSEVGKVRLGDIADVEGRNPGAHWHGTVTAWMSTNDYVEHVDDILPRLKVRDIVV